MDLLPVEIRLLILETLSSNCFVGFMSLSTTSRAFRSTYNAYEHYLLQRCFHLVTGRFAVTALLLSNPKTFNNDQSPITPEERVENCRLQSIGIARMSVDDMKLALQAHLQVEWLADFAFGSLEAFVEALDIEHCNHDEALYWNLRFPTSFPGLGNIEDDVRHQSNWEVADWVPAVYFYLLRQSAQADTRKMRLFKTYLTTFDWLNQLPMLKLKGFKEYTNGDTVLETANRYACNRNLYKKVCSIFYLLVRTEAIEALLLDTNAKKIICEYYGNFIGNARDDPHGASVRELSTCHTIVRQMIEREWDCILDILKYGISRPDELRRFIPAPRII